MKTALRLIAIAGTAAMLGGCQSFPLTSWMYKNRAPVRGEEAVLAGNTTGALDEGRAHLRDGNISAAVASFRIAQLDRSTRAEASNGLAVAYARLGRDDVAERYFQAAISAEPDNPKYIANLLRLQQATLARRAASGGTDLAVRSAPMQPAASRTALAASESSEAARSTLAGPLDRVSRNEVRVHSRSELGNAPAMAVTYRDAAPAEPAAEPVERDDKVAAAEPARQVPVRVAFGE